MSRKVLQITVGPERETKKESFLVMNVIFNSNGIATQEITLSLFMRVFFIIVTNVITKLKENMILNDISNLYMRE